MGKSLNEIAEKIKSSDKKVQLLYAFNGTGKTRLSRAFKELIEPKSDLEVEDTEFVSKKIIYYNAFTEDLFYWHNDIENDAEPKIVIQPNSFTEWIFKEQGQEANVISHFQNYTSPTVTPKFNENYSEITFSLKRGNEERTQNIKISKGEESNLIWSVFYSLLEEVIDVLNIPELEERETNTFDQLKYVFIDDPVTSLDDNHLIQMAVDLASLIRSSDNGLKFIITTHNPLFYNVLYNEIKPKKCFMLVKNEDGSYELNEKFGDSNKNFSYHHHLIGILKQAIDNNQIEKYHFTLLRNLYEKAANFLGYEKWSDLLPEDKELYASRIMNFYSHRTLLNEEIKEPSEPEKQMVKFLFEHLIDNAKFWKEE